MEPKPPAVPHSIIPTDVFVQAFKSNPAAISITRLSDGMIVEINEAWESLFGFKREESIGRSSIDLNLWPTPESRLQFLEAIRKAGNFRSQELTILKSSGQPCTVLLSADLITVSGEEVIITTWQDITERKQTERALSESSEKLEMALRSSGMGMWRVDLQQQIRHFEQHNAFTWQRPRPKLESGTGISKPMK
jgi:PAS domain S-box-containing protein